MEKILLIVHVCVSLSLIGLVLLQYAKGAEAGAAWGSGSSQTFFGSQGSGSFLTRVTAVLAALFFMTSLSLGYMLAKGKHSKAIEHLLKHNSEVPKIPE